MAARGAPSPNRCRSFSPGVPNGPAASPSHCTTSASRLAADLPPAEPSGCASQLAARPAHASCVLPRSLLFRHRKCSVSMILPFAKAGSTAAFSSTSVLAVQSTSCPTGALTPPLPGCEHPGVEVIVRDHSTEYARGASEGAPQARQVVDRWHLLVNQREMLERLLTRRHAHLCGLPAPEALRQQLNDQHQQLPRPLRLPSKREAAAKQARRGRRYARYEQVRALHAIGLPITQIAERLKSIKRQMYGRASLEVLRIRVLNAA
jgi:transposase